MLSGLNWYSSATLPVHASVLREPVEEGCRNAPEVWLEAPPEALSNMPEALSWL
jgi:hypothetical protein